MLISEKETSQAASAGPDQSIEPRRAPPLRVPANDLSGVMMGDPPLVVFSDEQVGRSQRAAVEFFLAQHEGDIAVKEHLFIETGDARGVRVRQDALPALYDC